MPHDEHRNLGPILTLIPDLFRNELILWQTADFRGPQLPPLLSFLQSVVETILIKERRVGKAREGGEEPGVPPFAPDCSLPNKFRSESSDAFPILEVVDVYLVFDLSPSVKCHSPCSN